MLRNWPGYEGTLAQPLPDEASRAAQNQEVSEADASSDESMSGANYTQPFRTRLSVRSSTQRSGDHLSQLSWGGTGCLRPSRHEGVAPRLSRSYALRGPYSDGAARGALLTSWAR